MSSELRGTPRASRLLPGHGNCWRGARYGPRSSRQARRDPDRGDEKPRLQRLRCRRPKHARPPPEGLRVRRRRAPGSEPPEHTVPDLVADDDLHAGCPAPADRAGNGEARRLDLRLRRSLSAALEGDYRGSTPERKIRAARAARANALGRRLDRLAPDSAPRFQSGGRPRPRRRTVPRRDAPARAGLGTAVAALSPGKHLRPAGDAVDRPRPYGRAQTCQALPADEAAHARAAALVPAAEHARRGLRPDVNRRGHVSLRPGPALGQARLSGDPWRRLEYPSRARPWPPRDRRRLVHGVHAPGRRRGHDPRLQQPRQLLPRRPRSPPVLRRDRLAAGAHSGRRRDAGRLSRRVPALGQPTARRSSRATRTPSRLDRTDAPKRW